jgi:NifB/MoaA-like Fe-S oxidoreductase
VTPEFCRRTIKEVEKLQKEFRKTLGVTFAFLGDEIYIKAGMEIPSRRHYGNYPQIEDGVGMIRSFLNSFENLIKEIHRRDAETQRTDRAETRVSASVQISPNVRTHNLAIKPKNRTQNSKLKTQNSLYGTVLTGEMFAPIFGEQIEKLNSVLDSRLKVLAVPNTYFGGDVAVAGLLSGQDYLKIKDKIEGDFVIIPKHTIKSDEPVLIDGMQFEDLKRRFDIPVYDLDLDGFFEFILN